ncbi:MAG: efflux RND transporter periplasmic adaptor subunit [Bacteroidales bacterium]|nr:efflux RND transporter periplasmic adaptor subunit [Bacteroidales bacterium]
MKPIKFIILIILLCQAGCRNKTIKTPADEITRVRVMEITPESVSIPVHSSGILASSEEMKLSFKTGGIVAKINFREGDKVKKDQVLATLNLSEIKANVNLAVNGYEKALRDWTRAKNLYADTVATLEQLQNATTALNIAESNLNIAQFNLSHSTILAPDNGVILKQLVKANEMVASGFPVFLFGASGKFWRVKSGLSDRDVVKINQGDSASVIIDAYPDIVFSAVVDQISGMSNPMTGTYEVELSLKDMGYRLAAGFIAGIDIYPAVKQAFIMLPVGAVIDADGEKGFIWSVTDSGTVKKLEVEIETLSGQKVAVKGIPDSVREIVSEGAAYLREGERVKVVK